MQYVETIIIGAGVSGLAKAKVFFELEKDVLVLEQQAGLGGVWRTTQYQGLGTHTSGHLYRYLSFPWGALAPFHHKINPLDLLPDQPSRADVLNYLAVYSEPFKHLIRYGMKVEEVIYDSKEAIFHLTVLNTEGQKIEYACKYLIATIGNKFNAGQKKPLCLVENDHSIEAMHSCDFTQPELYRDKKILLIGTGKSAQDILLSFAKADISDVTVLYYRSLWAVYYHAIIRSQKSLQFKIAFLLKAILGWNSLTRPMIKFLIKNFMVNLFDANEDPNNWNLAVIKAQHVELLQKFPSQKITLNSSHRIKNKQLWIGQQNFSADLVIYATGFEPLSQASFFKMKIQEGNEIKDFHIQHLYNGTMCVELPQLFIPCGRTGLPSSIQSELDALWIASRLFGKNQQKTLERKYITAFPFNFDPRSMLKRHFLYTKLFNKFTRDITAGKLFHVRLNAHSNLMEQIELQKFESILEKYPKHEG